MHDDGLGGPDPSLDLRNHAGRSSPSADRWRPRVAVLRGAAAAAQRGVAALGEVLVHVLGEVAEEDELLLEGGRDLAGGQVARAVHALTKLNVTESKRTLSLDHC